MKAFERIVRNEILTMTKDELDPFQFAYRALRLVEDAIITLLNFIVKHLAGSQNYVMFLCIDFCSAFNCIQSHILAHNNFAMDFITVCWLMSFLTYCSQRVKVIEVLSSVLSVVHHKVLTPLLFVVKKEVRFYGSL